MLESSTTHQMSIGRSLRGTATASVLFKQQWNRRLRDKSTQIVLVWSGWRADGLQHCGRQVLLGGRAASAVVAVSEDGDNTSEGEDVRGLE